MTCSFCGRQDGFLFNLTKITVANYEIMKPGEKIYCEDCFPLRWHVSKPSEKMPWE